MKLGTRVHHVYGYKTVASDFLTFAWGFNQLLLIQPTTDAK